MRRPRAHADLLSVIKQNRTALSQRECGGKLRDLVVVDPIAERGPLARMIMATEEENRCLAAKLQLRRIDLLLEYRSTQCCESAKKKPIGSWISS